MTHAQFSVVYDGPALADHTIDVRDLAPALLAIGELFDAANSALNGDAVAIKVNVRAHEPGCFSIDLDVVQSIIQQGIALLAGDELAAAEKLRDWLLAAGAGLMALIWRLRGRKPEKIERLENNMLRITADGQTFDVPLQLLRLYQDIAVRAAVERVVATPLESEGITSVAFVANGRTELRIEENQVFAYLAPHIEDHVLVDDVRRGAFSIISLAFKESNKWRLHDGQNQISATIADEDFMRRVDQNQVRFSKGDVLLCDVRVVQKQTSKGLTTDHIVVKVIEHRPAPRQIDWLIEDSRNDDP